MRTFPLAPNVARFSLDQPLDQLTSAACVLAFHVRPLLLLRVMVLAPGAQFKPSGSSSESSSSCGWRLGQRRLLS